MFLNTQFNLQKLSLTLWLGMILSILLSVKSLPSSAENRAINFDDKQTSEDNDESGLEQTLEHNFSPEDRMRLRKALDDYAKSTDPTHNRIEQKRKLMKENVQTRFNGCDKDSDDSIDREEAMQCLPQIARHFNYVDIDEDGVITLEELQLAQAKSIERQKAAEARIEAQKIEEDEMEIKNRSKAKVNKIVSSSRKRPS